MKKKTQILMIHGGMTFRNKKDYLHYLKTREISIEKRKKWAEGYFDKELVNEWKTIDIGKLAEKINVPCKFIFAGNYNKFETWKPFLGKIKVANEFAIVEGASHVFIEEGVEEKLFEETLNYIRI